MTEPIIRYFGKVMALLLPLIHAADLIAIRHNTNPAYGGLVAVLTILLLIPFSRRIEGSSPTAKLTASTGVFTSATTTILPTVAPTLQSTALLAVALGMASAIAQTKCSCACGQVATRRSRHGFLRLATIVLLSATHPAIVPHIIRNAQNGEMLAVLITAIATNGILLISHTTPLNARLKA